MGGATLFGDDFGGTPEKSKAQKRGGEARVKRPDRRQSLLRPQVIDRLIASDHRARAIVRFVEKLNLDAFYAEIGSRGSDPGRPATDPAMLLALWLFATSEGVGSGRQLERLCERDDAYRWICGGVQVNYHTLTDFRVSHGKALDELMTQGLGVLMHQGLVQLRRIAQDGVRVRAHAGTSSFRTARGLRKCLSAAREQIRQAKTMLDKDDPTRKDKQRVAAERAAREREARIERAMQDLKKIQASKKTDEEAERARASTTDPESRTMRMADGGYRPAYNMQFAVDADTRAIVGVGVTNVGSDIGQIAPMVDEVERRTGKRSKEWLVDGGYTCFEDIQTVGEQGVKVLSPVPLSKAAVVDPHQPKPTDPKHVAEWRKRMATDKAKETYKLRAATSECTNADLRAHRGLQQLPVRGLDKVLMVGLWTALTYNALLWIRTNAAML